MKEKIYTIPVIDCFKAESECPFCAMYDKLNQEATEYMMGPSYMQDDVRLETDKTGFCKEHYKKMYGKKNRLGLALMLHTHLKKINNDFNSMKEDTLSSKKTPFKKNGHSKIIQYIDTINKSCYICNKINITFERYMDTFFYLWKTDKEIIPLIENCKGFCIFHFSMLLSESEKKLNQSVYNEFVRFIFPIQLERLKILEEDLDWFINKYDYRYKNEPWKNSKDSVLRALGKISSVIMESEEDEN